VPEPKGSDPKEVFAFFGLAAYHGQVLEQELLIFALTLNLSGRTCVTRADVEGLLSALERRTLGQLLNEARTFATIPAGLENDLNAALARRNDLVHRFFERRSEDFMSDAGRLEMLSELQQTTRLFQEVDAAVVSVREPLSQKLGITQELAQQELDKTIARASARAHL
jgi:hypothetical protein